MCRPTKLLIICLLIAACKGEVEANHSSADTLQAEAQLLTGAEQLDTYVSQLKGKNIALAANHTSLVGKTHLLDTLLSLGVKVKSVFAPEHGFRGEAEAGASIKGGTDPKTGVRLVSLYGKNKKPTDADLQGIETVVFDIQDVGCRFYTYISTLHYVMEACAENNIPLIVLDRPNPNGHFVDGPVLEKEFASFVGMHPVPVVYGMTIGEYAQMINGEGWLANGAKCNLKVVPLQHYNRMEPVRLPVPPSPNLPTFESIVLYPSLCFFEGTDVSVGRGTKWPFEVVGKPGFAPGDFTFLPVSIPGKAENPPYQGKECRGLKLTAFAADYLSYNPQIYLYWLTGFYEASTDKSKFFASPGFFDKLAGTDQLRKQIVAEKTPEEIKAIWQPGLAQFKLTRKKYLLYADSI